VQVSILLSTYNGKEYLKEQLDSLFSQTYKNIKIIVRDDGSTDKTLEILKSYGVHLLESHENIGPKKSFSLLLEYAIEHSDRNYFMFCDQDDIWEKDKIEKTLQKMQELEFQYKDIPLLVHTDLQVVDDFLHVLSRSFWKHEYINPNINSFNKLLLQNTITGCTMMINRKLARLSLPIPDDAIVHDWWIGLVASKFGKIGFINDSTILYRQHASNSIGAKGFSYLSILIKFYKVFFKNELYLKHLKINISQAKAFLDIYRDILDEGTIEMLEEFSTLESKSFLEKRKILLKHKLLKQGLIRNLGLLLKI